MRLKKNIKVGKIKFFKFIKIFLFSSLISYNSYSDENLEGVYTNIKILDKISSKNVSIKLKNGEDIKYKDLSIKSMKCKT